MGTNVAIHGDWIVVGAGLGCVDLGSGSAFVYHRDDNGTPNDPTDDTTVEALRALFESGEKLKADDFGRIFSDATTGARHDPD